MATVTHLPNRSDALDAEIVTPEEWARVQQRRTAAARRDGYRRDAVTVTRVTRDVVTHPVTRGVTRNLLYVPAGGYVLARRYWEAKTNSRYERVMRAAEACGDMDRLAEWEQRGEQSRERRHKRAMDWVRAPLELAKAGVVAVVAVVALLIGLGVVLALGNNDPTWVTAPLHAVVTLVTTIAWVVTVVWGPLVLAVPWLLVLVCWHIGRRADVTPAWLAPSRVTRDDTITPSKVVTAFRDLGIPTLRKSVTAMGDAGAAMLSPIRIAGRGVEVDVTLCPGVTTLEVIAKRRRLAENLDRHEHEVYPTVAPTPRTVRVWVADPGALDEPVGPSPLTLDDELTADMYTGRAPWGQDLRGDAVAMPLLQRHILVTGLSNQGKTAAVRALALWAALDPTVELRIADLKGIGDWRMFRGLASVLIEGPADEHVVAATEMLEDGVREMERRLQALDADRYPDGVTRELARRPGSGFGHRILIVDEAQNAYMCPLKGPGGTQYGGKKDSSRFFTAARKLHNQGRAVNIMLWQGTQDPTDQNLPKLVREGAHIRASLVVGTEEQSRMALGPKAVDAGAAPHDLRAGVDKGVLVVAGDGVPLPPGQFSMTVRTHFIDGASATRIAEQVKAARGPVLMPEPGEVRDVLQDVHEALGPDEMVRAPDMAARLRELAPGYRAYARMDGAGLAELLAAEGVEVRRKDGYPVVRADRVLRALDERQDVE